jgi:hypothetical protein
MWGIVSAAFSLSADTGAWSVDGDGAWTNSANWLNGVIASGTDGTAYFTHRVTLRRTVSVDQPVTIGAMRFGSPTNKNWHLVGEGPIFLDNSVSNPRIGSTVNQRVEILTPLAGTNGFVQEALAVDIKLDGANQMSGLGELGAQRD